MDRLIIEEEWYDDVVVLKLRGLIDSGTAQYLEEKFNDLVSGEKVKIVVDLQGIDYISSAGWGIFIGEIKGIRHRGGDIKLAGMRPNVQEVFELLEFGTLLKPYNSLEDSLEAFTARNDPKLS